MKLNRSTLAEISDPVPADEAERIARRGRDAEDLAQAKILLLAGGAGGHDLARAYGADGRLLGRFPEWRDLHHSVLRRQLIEAARALGATKIVFGEELCRSDREAVVELVDPGSVEGLKSVAVEESRRKGSVKA